MAYCSPWVTDFYFFHPEGLVETFCIWHLLVSMNAVLLNAVTTKVPDRFERVDFTIDFDFETFQGLLNDLTDVAETNIDSCCSDACFSRLLRSLEEVLKLRIKGDGKGRVDQMAVHMGSNVDLADISVC